MQSVICWLILITLKGPRMNFPRRLLERRSHGCLGVDAGSIEYRQIGVTSFRYTSLPYQR